MVAIQHGLFPETGVASFPCYKFDNMIRVDVVVAVIEHQRVSSERKQLAAISVHKRLGRYRDLLPASFERCGELE